MYAIIATGGKQYKVTEGDIIRVEKLEAAEGDKITFDQVLMIGGEDAVIGNPTVSGASVSATVTANGKADKVIVYKYNSFSQRLRSTASQSNFMYLRSFGSDIHA